jgi:MFS family permease
MVAAMTGVSAGLDRAGHDLRTIGLVVSVFVGSMFVPSPVAGWLSDRIGGRRIVALGAVLIVVSGAFLDASASGPAGRVDLGLLSAGLILLGAGWNFGYVSGSALLGAGALLIRVQGAGEAIRGVAAIAGAILSSMMLATSGMAGLGLIVSATGLVLGGAIAANKSIQWRRSARPSHRGSRLLPAAGPRRS